MIHGTQRLGAPRLFGLCHGLEELHGVLLWGLVQLVELLELRTMRILEENSM